MTDGVPIVACELCGRAVAVHDSYVVRIDAYADPSIPPIDTASFGDGGPGDAIDALIEQMAGLSADDLQDAVHRRFEYRLCPPCHRRFLANPLGKPRGTRAGVN